MEALRARNVMRLLRVLAFALIACFAISSPLVAESTYPVTIKSFQQIAVYPKKSVPASVVSLNDSKLSAEVSAIVDVVPVLVGESVKPGTELVRLDSSNYKLSFEGANAALDALTARIEFAKYQLSRTNTLSKQQALSDELLKQRESNLKVLQADLVAQKIVVAKAKQDVEKCIIRAPFAAVVVQRLAQVGEYANPGTPLIRIIDIKNLEISAHIQAQDVKSLRLAQNPILINQGKQYKLTLRAVTPFLYSSQRSQEVRLKFVSQFALPGSSGKLVWRQTSPHVPVDIMVSRKGTLGVFILDGSKAHFYPLTGALEGRLYSPDFPLDTQIIEEGRFNLEDGNPVTIVR